MKEIIEYLNQHENLKEVLWKLLEIFATAFVIDRAIKWNESRKLKPMRKQFVINVIKSIDNANVVSNFAFNLMSLRNLGNSALLTTLENSFDNFNKYLENIQSRLMSYSGTTKKIPANENSKNENKPLVSKTDIIKLTWALERYERELNRIISQIDACQLIFTVEMNSIVAEIRIQMTKDIECIYSLRQYLENPCKETHVYRTKGCIFSYTQYLDCIERLNHLIGNKTDLKNETSSKIISDLDQAKFIDEFCDIIPHDIPLG